MVRQPSSAEASPLVRAVTAWFDAHERPLPWRASTPWGVLVSEFMLQQTPVDRVLPVWTQWLQRWPEPAALAGASVGDAVRDWGRLGYPRRARRLHETATLIVERHGGRVPDETEDLRALPGIGEYTAAAILAFAFGRRSIVLDTNVRRVLVRAREGRAMPAAHLTNDERRAADLLWPAGDAESARWSAAVMELGALVCTARTPSCEQCPVITSCAWHQGGRPAAEAATRAQPRYEGSDRQARGALLAMLRERTRPVAEHELASAWPDDEQRGRALASLLADGLVDEHPDGGMALPT